MDRDLTSGTVIRPLSFEGHAVLVKGWVSTVFFRFVIIFSRSCFFGCNRAVVPRKEQGATNEAYNDVVFLNMCAFSFETTVALYELQLQGFLLFALLNFIRYYNGTYCTSFSELQF